MFLDMPDPLRNMSPQRLSVRVSPVLECLVSLFALQNPDVFPRGRSWRQRVMSHLDKKTTEKLSFYFPEGHFAFNMGVFGSFLIAPECRDMVEFTERLSEYAQHEPPQGMPVSWNSSQTEMLERTFQQTHRLLPPRHLYERYQWCISHQQVVLSDIAVVLKDYWDVFLMHDKVWRAAVNSKRLEFERVLADQETLDLVELCSSRGSAVVNNYVLEKLRGNPDYQVVLVPSFFTYPYVANLDEDNLFFLIVPAEHGRSWQLDVTPVFSDSDLAAVFKALSDETRLAIINLLKEGPKYGLEVAEALGITQPTASHHLNYLAKAGLLQVVKEGSYTYYYLNKTKLQQAAADLLAKTGNDQ